MRLGKATISFFMNIRSYSLFILLGMVLLIVCPFAHATVPDVSGTYTGPVTGDLNCPGESPPIFATETTTLTFLIPPLPADGSFSSSQTLVIQGVVISFTTSGTVDSAGNISGDINGTANSFLQQTITGNISGSISGGTFNFNVSAQSDSICFVDVSGTLTLIAGGQDADLLVDPAITPSSTLTGTNGSPRIEAR